MTHDFDHLGDDEYGDTDSTAVDDTNEDLLSRFPGYLPRGQATGHWALMRPVAQEIRDAEHDIESIDFAGTVQNAETIDQLSKLGALLDTPPDEGESKAHYRARLLAEGMLATSEGTISDIILGAAEILDTDKNNIEYDEPIRAGSENGTASVGMPGAALDGQQLTDSEVAAFLDKIAPVGCRIQGIREGTFEYIDTADYNASVHDADKGYDGLDSGGNAKDNGGTYSGTI